MAGTSQGRLAHNWSLLLLCAEQVFCLINELFVQLLKSEHLWDELLEYIRGQGDTEDVHHSSDTINDDK